MIARKKRRKTEDGFCEEFKLPCHGGDRWWPALKLKLKPQQQMYKNAQNRKCNKSHLTFLRPKDAGRLSRDLPAIAYSKKKKAR